MNHIVKKAIRDNTTGGTGLRGGQRQFIYRNRRKDKEYRCREVGSYKISDCF